MRKLTVFMHVSLDMFVAGPNGEMDWITVDDAIFDYAGQRTDVSDTALYGRVTWQMMEGYWPTAADKPNAGKHDIQHSQWYNHVQKVVVSKSLQGQELKNTQVVADNVAAQVQALKQQPGKEILVLGSPSVVHLLGREGLVDDYWLFVNPVLLGQGIPMFRDLQDRARLKLADTVPFPTGVVCLHYEKA